MNAPCLPLAEPLRGIEANTFTHYTIAVRFGNILRRVLEETPWSEAIQERLMALLVELPHGVLRPISDPQAPDEGDWQRYMAPYQGQTWLEAPWFAVEMYFFRRILEATGYFQAGPGQGVDPYALQKRQAMALVPRGIRPLCAFLTEQQLVSPEDGQQVLANLLRMCTWSNQSDLSMWPVGDSSHSAPARSPDYTAHLLCDDSLLAAQYLGSLRGASKRVDFILDNGGVELAHDLALADFLLSHRWADEVCFHARPYPMYVSDATQQDVLEMVEALVIGEEVCLKALAERLKGYLDNGRLRLTTDFFWASPLSGWELPPHLRETLRHASLIINKGDANYRRWVGDRHWAPDLPVEQVLCYLPAPWLALRVLKAETIIGLRPGQAQQMYRQDASWMYNGKWGIIQFYCPSV